MLFGSSRLHRNRKDSSTDGIDDLVDQEVMAD